MAAIRGMGSDYPCPVCLIPLEMFPGLSDTYPLRTSESMKEIYDLSQKAETVADTEALPMNFVPAECQLHLKPDWLALRPQCVQLSFKILLQCACVLGAPVHDTPCPTTLDCAHVHLHLLSAHAQSPHAVAHSLSAYIACKNHAGPHHA